jgi:hypothetical protein
MELRVTSGEAAATLDALLDRVSGRGGVAPVGRGDGIAVYLLPVLS